MPIQVSRAHLSRLHHSARLAMARGDRIRKRAEGAIEQGVCALEVGAASFGFGVVQGRTGGVKVVGVPLDLGAAVILHLAGFTGIAGKMADHAHSLGNGALASYLTSLGRGIGIEMRKKLGVSGDGQRLTDADLKALADMAR